MDAKISKNNANCIMIIALMSIVKEIVPIPFVELNQLVLIVCVIFCVIKSNGNCYIYRDNQYLNLSIIGIIGYMLVQGLLMSTNKSFFIGLFFDYLFVFILIIMISNVSYNDYHYMLYNLRNIISIAYLLEFVLWRFNTPFYLYIFNEPFANIRNCASFLSPNSYAIVLSFLIVGFIDCAISKKKLRYIVVAVLLTFPFLTTASKSGLLILLLGIILDLYLSRIIGVKILIIGSIVVAFSWLKSGYLLSVISSMDNYYARRIALYLNQNSILGERLLGIENLVKLWKDKLIFGVGFGNINGEGLFVDYSSEHNEYLRFLVEGGLVGFILFMIFICSIIRKIYLIAVNKVRVSKEWRYMVVSGCMFLASELFYNYFAAPREGFLLAILGLGCICRRNVGVIQ